MTALYVPGLDEQDPKKIIRALHVNQEVNTPGQRKGIDTNTAASAGNIGEVIESTVLAGAAISLTSGVEANITSISLTPGNWLAWGNVGYVPAGTTTSTGFAGWISSTSATFPTAPNGGAFANINLAHSAGNSPFFAIGSMHISLGSTTTIYLSGYSAFAVSTMKIYGYIGALRVS